MKKNSYFISLGRGQTVVEEDLIKALKNKLILGAALDVFENVETARNWLKKSNRALAGKTPLELLDTDAGTQQVDQLLNKIEHGVYS